MKFRLALITAAVILLSATTMVLRAWKGKPEEKVHYHAGFLVYIDGVLQDYSSDRYMRDVPCAAPGKSAPANKQLEKAHLHDGVGDVIHVEEPGAVWNDAFANMGVSLPSGKPVVAYDNGKPVTDPLRSAILPGQSVVFIVGNSAGTDPNKSVTEQHIKEAGEKSESCN